MMQKIPDEGVSADGDTITLAASPKNDCLIVTRHFGDDLEKRRVTTNFTHHPHAINRFRELVGLEPIPVEELAPKPVPVVTTECEHDWEWANPDDDDDRSITCSKCGEIGEAEDD